MGIPYSREINAAFEQVTPLVAAGFKVLKTTKNISILLAVIQVLTVLFLAFILIVLLGIMYSVNPDLEVCCEFCFCVLMLGNYGRCLYIPNFFFDNSLQELVKCGKTHIYYTFIFYYFIALILSLLSPLTYLPNSTNAKPS